MSDLGAASGAAKAIGDPFGTLGGLLAGFVPEGPLRTLVLVVVGLCAALAPVIYKYYLGVLAQGAKPEESLERQDYDRLRASLAGSNLAARLYAKWLTALLDRADRLFGDADMADRTLFPHAFWLKIPVPLWTPRSFDRCLYLALIYPVWTIFALWAISGHVGPAEAALGLKPDAPLWIRMTLLAGTELALIAIVHANLWEFRKSRAWKAASIFIPFHVNNLIDILTNRNGAFALIVVFALLLSGALDGGLAFAITAIVVFIISDLNDRAEKGGWQGIFLALFVPAMIVSCLAVAFVLSHLKSWGTIGPLVLFLILFTVLVAPFNWATLGFTRALMRRGIELGGWWPYLLSLTDACLASAVAAYTTSTIVIGIQAFNGLAVHGGGEKAAVLPLDALFDGIAKNPGAPEYWWAYAFLFSTMIPSLINLAIGAWPSCKVFLAWGGFSCIGYPRGETCRTISAR